MKRIQPIQSGMGRFFLCGIVVKDRNRSLAVRASFHDFGVVCDEIRED